MVLRTALLAAAVGTAEAWRLVWSDEFDGTSVDTSKWNYDLGNGVNGWGNQELQWYTDRREQVAVVDRERLVISATRRSDGRIESGKLTSKFKGDWRYGRFEAKIKVPAGRGTWPAFWMLPTDNRYGHWPNSGEIDIMEHVGFDYGIVHGTVHTTAGHGGSGTGGCIATSGREQGKCNRRVPGNVRDWHVYAVEWNADKISWFFDGILYQEYFRSGGSAQWPFNQRFFLILNLAVGGTWGGARGVDYSIFDRPVQLEVDYVRVYAPGDGTTPPGTVPPTPPAGAECYEQFDVEADGHTCLDRMLWVLSQTGSAQRALTVAYEFPDKCGACRPQPFDPAPPAGVPQRCLLSWQSKAGEYTCGARIKWLLDTQPGLTPSAAMQQVSGEFAAECRTCQ